MAEQTSNDVVNQTRSDGDFSPSDVPASTFDKFTAGGDGEDIQAFDNNPQNTTNTNAQENGVDTNTHMTDNGTSVTSAGDGSGGSDTDASRNDMRRSADGAQHARTSSVKRPSAFKPVSFAKFSITKTSGASPVLKPAVEKVPFSSSNYSTISPQQTSRPRLVAKTASGLRDSAPRSSSGGNKNGSNAPDPNLVWNKNKPAQPTPSKHLTDEELKQQYGIHMTSRIHSDGNGKESKWADIDDDEDDWAPETIEWNDGTKITLGQTETLVPPTAQTTNDVKPQPKAPIEPVEPPLESKPAPREIPKPPLSKPATSLGPNTRILKLGANMEKQQARQSGDISRSGEKSTLTSKGPAPPSRSPWAPLPPVEKVPPIAVNPPSEGHPTSRFLQTERPGPEGTTRSSSPTKEIAADDFNRSWRDSNVAAPRELYNSQSDRYEPVSENRRGPPRTDRLSKQDSHFRPSSLLQRPMHNDSACPAEPSAAFQTHRSGVEGSSWGRRRTSSNVSGGSGVLGRRMSMSKPDLSFKGRETSAQRGASPSNGIIDAGSPSQQSATNHYTPPTSYSGLVQQTADAPNAQLQPPAEDPVAMQQRIMREKRDMARQRRLEEEAKEEAAKQERIKLKLQSMGLAPSENTAAKDSPTTAKPKRPSVGAIAQSPPKPPVPEPSGEPKQYGMMKVHHPESVKKLVGPSTTDKTSEKSHGMTVQSRQATSPREGRFESPESTPGPAINGAKVVADASPPMPSQPIREPQPDDRNLQWKYSLPPTSSYSSWPSTKAHAPTPGALWGPPSNDKALGNGTFDRNLTSFPPQDLLARGSLGLSDQPHILPPPPNNERIDGPDSLTQSLHGTPRGVADSSQPLSPLPSPERRPVRLNAKETPKPIARPGPIAPPSHPQGQRWQQDQIPYRSQETAAWHNFHTVANKVEAEDNERFHRELKALHEEEARTGISPSLQATFNETWRQVETGDHGGQRNIIGVTKTSDRDAQVSPLRQLESAVTGLPFADKPKPMSAPPARGSRFFPQGAEQKRPGNQEPACIRSPSPPPPEEISSHPVFTGDSNRPLVHLPTPKPRVKLPPRKKSPPPPQPQPPATFASMVASPPPTRVPSKPIASTPSWQDRFNGLFGKKPSQPSQGTKNSLAVASATKEPLEVLSSPSSAAVSLPHRSIEVFRNSIVTSKEVEDEEEIFEDREAGSLPVVKVPNMAPRAAWQPALPPSQSRFRSKYQKPVEAHSIEPYFLGYFEKETSADVTIIVRPPGKAVTKKLLLPKKGGNNATRQRSSNPKHRKSMKPKEGAGSYVNSHSVKKATTAANNRAASPKLNQRNSK